MKNAFSGNKNGISNGNTVVSSELKLNENKYLLLTEFILVYFLIPLLIYFKLIVFSKMLILFLLALVALLILYHDNNFDKKRLLLVHCQKYHFLSIFLRFCFSSAAILLLILIFSPRAFSQVTFNKPLTWITSSLSYLSMSVIPQELIYRTYLFHRYRLIFKGNFLPIAISTFSFTFAHIVYENYFALVLTLIGGYYFSVTYQKSRSLIITVAEHFMYGMFIFSIGIGGILSGE